MITRLEVNNYRCLRYNKLDLPPFAALIGPNAAGKSTFFDALGLLSDLMSSSLDQALFFNGRTGHGRCSSFQELCFNGEGNLFEIAVELKIPGSVCKLSYSKARYEIQIGAKSPSDEVHILNENLYLFSKKPSGYSPITKQTEMFPSMELDTQTSLFMAPGKKKTPTGMRKVVSKTETGNDYFGSETTKWNNLFKFGAKKTALANLIEDPIKFPLSTWVRDYLREGIETLALNSRAMRMPCGPNAPERFLPDGSNLPKVVRRFKDRKNLFGDWLSQLRTALPDIHNVDVIERPEDKHLYLTIDYGQGKPVPSWLVSDGTLRMIALTLISYLPDMPASTYLIEEPENGIHPKALETVMQALDAAQNIQVLLASHSPRVLGLLEPEKMLCFAKNQYGATDIIHGPDHPVLRNWTKESVSLEHLFVSGVLA